ncbi:DNA/RNA non-specific endonuclease [Geodermatophilus maliterrae]|uniref:DNA/RNA non-specific endonuclease n=1 Tax=Geodermatophilus maliterrae TaxID=3162531 RepID=A0ABV3X8U1_9ACTN
MTDVLPTTTSDGLLPGTPDEAGAEGARAEAIPPGVRGRHPAARPGGTGTGAPAAAGDRRDAREGPMATDTTTTDPTAGDPVGPSADGTGDRPRERGRLLAALGRLVRAGDAVSLADLDVSSVDVGYVTTGGRRVPEVSIRFTLDGEPAGPATSPSGGTTAAPEARAPAAVPEVAEGYDPSFLGVEVPAPVPGAAVRADVAPTVDGDTVVEHVHFSLQMSASRRFALWVAWNIDGGALKALSRSGQRFVKDPQVAEDLQVGDELYAGNRLDRGHIARRADLVWGSLPVAERANRDSFCFTNIAPQMDDFNQSARNGVWGRLENAVLADVDVEDLRVSVFGGPVFAADDRVYRGVRLPREFWKVIAFREAGALRARAFLLTQALHQLEALDLDEFRVFQVTLPEVEARTGLRFPDVLRAADTLVLPELVREREPLGSVADIRW